MKVISLDSVYIWYSTNEVRVDALSYMMDAEKKSLYVPFYNKYQKRITPLYR